MQASSADPPNLYPRLLGPAWRYLDAAVRAAHLHDGQERLWGRGQLEVRHGSNRLGRWLLSVLRMPAEAEQVAVHLTVTRQGEGERWHRRIGEQDVVSFQQEQPGGLLGERVGPLELRFHLAAEDGAIVFRQQAARWRWRRLSAPLPSVLSPRVAAREEPAAAGGGTRITVEVHLLGIGLLMRYRGEMQWGGDSG